MILKNIEIDHTNCIHVPCLKFQIFRQIAFKWEWYGMNAKTGVLLDCCSVRYSKAAVILSVRSATMPTLRMDCHREECISRWGKTVLCSVR